MAKKKPATAAQKAAVQQAAAVYDPTAFSTTGGWNNVKETAKINALAPMANAVDPLNSARQLAVNSAIAAGNQNTGTTEPYRGTTGPDTKNPVTEPTPATTESNALSQWTLEGDPIYQQAMQGGLSAFNTAKAGALFKLNTGQTALENQRKALDQNAWDARRQLAGNYAARGMQRGAYGAFYRAQDKQNAQQVAAQTDIKDQIAALNQDFLTNYGTAGADWTGTATGQDYRQKAIQLALQNRLTQAGVA
jgi:hypothetical protein